jgi:hypothetical protein
MEIGKAALEMLWRLSDEILKTLRETPAGASARKGSATKAITTKRWWISAC